MERLKAVRQGFEKQIPIFIICFCVLQPLLDVLAFWRTTLGFSAIVLTLLRALTFLGLTALGFFVSRRKRRYILLAAAALLYLAGHILAASSMGYQNPVADLTDQLRVLVLPFATAAMMSFLDRSDKAFRALETGLVLSLGVIALTVLLSVATGTDPHSYLGKQIGTLGWFLWPNSQSAILSMLTPLALAWCCERFTGRVFPVVLTSLECFGLLFLLGTRLSFVSIPVIGIGLAVCMWLADKAARRQALTIFLAALLFTALWPISPVREAQKRTAVNAVVKQQRIDAAVEACGEDPKAGRTENAEALAAAYRYCLQGTVDRFGLDRTAKAYDYSLDQATIFDGRRKKLVFNRLLMEDSNGLSHWFGLEISRMYQHTQLYDFYADSWTDGTEAFAPENDLHGVYYTGGWVLLAGILGWILWYGLRALRALIRGGRRVFSVPFAAFCASYGFFLIYAYATNSVLRQTRNIFCVSAVLAGLWYLSRSTETKNSGKEDVPQ